MSKAAEVAVELIDSFHDNMLFGLSEGMLSPDEDEQRWVHGFTVDEVGAALRFVQTASRREQRRARKARKNLVMYKTAGRRPWARKFLGRLAHRNESDALHKGLHYRQMLLGWMHNHEQRMRHIARCSGFLDMSRVAEGMR